MGNKNSTKKKDIVQVDPIWRAPNSGMTDELLRLETARLESAGLLEVWLLGNELTGLPANNWTALQVLYLNDNSVTNEINRFLLESGSCLEEVNLSANAPLSSVDGLSSCSNITQLYLNNLPNLVKLPEDLKLLSHLVVFQANQTGLEALPGTSDQRDDDYWPKLKQLSLTDNKSLKNLPECSWPNLQKLFLHRCALEKLPDSVSLMTSLTKLYFNDNPAITALPATLPSSIDELYFAQCDIEVIPESVLHLTELKFIMGEKNPRLRALPAGLLSLNSLEIAHFNHCALKELAGDFGRKVTFIHLAGNNLSDLPFESLYNLAGKLRKFEIEGNPVAQGRREEVQHILDNLVT